MELRAPNNLQSANDVYETLMKEPALSLIDEFIKSYPDKVICASYHKTLGFIVLTPVTIEDLLADEDDPEIIRGARTHQRHSLNTYCLVLQFYVDLKIKERGIAICEKRRQLCLQNCKTLNGV